MAKGKAVPGVEEYAPTLNFDFPKDNEKAIPAPENFDSIGVDDEITVVVKGKVESIRHDAHSKSFGMTFSKVKIKLPNAKPKSIADAMAEAQEKRQP